MVYKVVVPLVDEGRLDDINQRENLVGFLLQRKNFYFHIKYRYALKVILLL